VDAAQRNQWLEAAARAGFAQAVNDLGMRAQALNDQVAAARQYEIAARLGLAEASRNLGRLCALRAVSSADAQRARGHTLAAAEAGDVVAMIDLADYCDHGFGGPADRAAAQGWLERAAGSGHWFGQLAKGKALLAGRYGLVADRDAGLRCFEQAVTSRCGPALLRVAEALARGDGFPADGKQAAVLAELAYVQGASEAASMLADLYTQGAASVVKDSDLAQFWRTRGGPPAAHTDDQDPRAARLEQLDPFATPIFQVAPR
jgi:TPR repeat protein